MNKKTVVRAADDVPALTGLRGVAALTVVLSHSSIRHMYLAPGLDFEGTGKLGVWLFFVLSAYLLTRQLLVSGKPLAGAVLGKYLIRRFFRIYPLYVVALAIDIVLSRIPADRFTPSVLLRHAPDIFWTIPVEFQYYFCIPVVAFLLLSFGRAIWLGVLFMVLLFATNAALPGTEPALWPYLTIFLAGSLGAYLSVNIRLQGQWLPGLALLCAVLIANAAPAIMRLTTLDAVFDPDVLRNTPVLFGPLFTPVVLASVNSASWARLLSARPLIFLGEISYGLYLLHPLAVAAVNPLDAPAAVKGALVIAGAIALATLAYHAIERPCRRLGYRLTGLARGKHSAQFSPALACCAGSGYSLSHAPAEKANQMAFVKLKNILRPAVAQPSTKKAKPEAGFWDVHFQQWIREAEAKGLDPNDVGDAAWANDYLAQVLETRYLRFVPQGGTVLELGPGSGRLTRHLIGRAGRIELIDNSQFVIEWMNRYLAGKVAFRATHIENPLIPHIGESSIDTILSHGVFEHLDFDETYFFLHEFCRVIKPGGRISYNYNTLHNSAGAKWFLDHRRAPGSRCIFRFYTPDFMIRIAETAGLFVVDSLTSEERLAHIVLEKRS